MCGPSLCTHCPGWDLGGREPLPHDCPDFAASSLAISGSRLRGSAPVPRGPPLPSPVGHHLSIHCEPPCLSHGIQGSWVGIGLAWGPWQFPPRSPRPRSPGCTAPRLPTQGLLRERLPSPWFLCPKEPRALSALALGLTWLALCFLPHWASSQKAVSPGANGTQVSPSE